MEVQPPSDRKRVKVYELKDNDWFDRGTGFCTGQILDVSPGRRHVSGRSAISVAAPRAQTLRLSGARPQFSLLSLTIPSLFPRMSRGYSSSRRMSLIVCSWRQKSPRMTAIRNNKVRLPLTPSATSHASREIAECELTFPRREIETLIVWTEPNGTDMALSFQEAEGCAVIW